jgi:hypothetical protein
MAEKRHRAAADRRLAEENQRLRAERDYVFDPKRKLEAGVEGDPERLRAIARARRNKGNG